MKKNSAILILFLVCLLTCGCSSQNNNKQSENSAPPVSSSETDQYEQLESNPVIIQDSHLESFEMSSLDIARLIYGKDVDYYSQDIGTYTVDVFPKDEYLLFCVSTSQSNYPILVYAYDQSRGGTSTSSDELLLPFIENFSDISDVLHDAYSIDRGDSSRHIVSCVWIKGSDLQNYQLTLQITPPADYFLSVDTDWYNSACNEGRYNDIFDSINSYIENTNPPSYDNAYLLKSYLAPIMAHWGNISIAYDAIDNYATFYYSGVDCISDNIHLVPYATTNDRNIFVLSGFYNTDWLFFDKITISSSENITFFVGHNKTEDVISGNRIYEAYDISLDEDEISELLSSSEHTIRFSGVNATHLDFEVTSQEFDAISCISNFYNIRNILSDLRYHFQLRLNE